MDDDLVPLQPEALEKRIWILHIDDNERFLRLTERQLEAVSPDLHVETISNPENTLEKLQETRFDCILCDYQMPRIDGIDVLRQIREKYPNIPFILLTSKGSEDVASQAISENATDYIKKGGTRADYQLIVNRIENAVSKRRAEEEREKAFERMADAYFKIDNNWRFTYTNENAAEILDRPREQIIGENIWELYPEAREGMTIYEKYHEAMETQETMNFEEYLPSQDRWMNVYVYPSEDGLSVYLRDITERIQYERQLEQYQRIVETTEEMLYILDAKGNVTWINQETVDRLGYSREEMIGRNASEFVASTSASIEEIREKLESGEKSPLIEGELLTSSGEKIAVEGRFTPYESEDGEMGRMGVIREITERKERARELEQREKALQTITDGVYILDDERRFVFVNDAFIDITGYTYDEIIGSTPALVAEAETIHVMDRKQDELSGENPVGVAELNLNLADGTHLPVEIRFTHFQSEDIENGRIGVVRDISERKRREKETEQYRALTQAASEAIITIDEHSIIQSANPAVEDILGYTPDEIEGKPLMMLMSSGMKERHIKGIQQYLQTGEKNVDWSYIEFPGQHKDGSEVMLGISISEFEYDGERYFTGIAREITRRKETEHQLNQYREVVETIQDGVYAVDEKSRFIMVNSSLSEMLGYTKDELLGEHVSKIHSIDEDARKMSEEILERNLDVAKIKNELKTKGGDKIPVETRFVPFRIEDGVYGRTGVVRDISDRTEREKRLKRFGEIISHDLKNPLLIAQGSLELLQDSGHDEDFERLENSLQKIANMVEDLQLITLTSGEIETEEISLESVFEEAYRLSDVEPAYSVEDMRLEAGRTSLIRLLTNLITNSVAHNEEPVQIEVGPLENGNGFYYQDDGDGIPDERREEVFEYGFTTSKTGSGLGLPIVKRIVEVNDWEIELTDSETGGARFNIVGKNSY